MKNVTILRHGRRLELDINNREHAAEIGQKLIRLGRLLQNPELSTIVPKRYFNRTDERNAVFFALMHGDNGKFFEVCFLVEQLADEDSFDIPEIGIEPR